MEGCVRVCRKHENILTYFEASGGPTVQILSITLKRLFAPALRRHSQFLQQILRWGVCTRLNLTSIFVFMIIVLFIFGIFETIFQVYLRLNCVLWFSFLIWSWIELQFFPLKCFVYTNWRHLVVRIQTATLTSPVWPVDLFPSCWCGGRLERVFCSSELKGGGHLLHPVLFLWVNSEGWRKTGGQKSLGGRCNPRDPWEGCQEVRQIKVGIY